MVGAVAVVAVLGTASAPASGGPPGNAVTAWNEIAVNTLTGLPGPAGGTPPAAQVHVAMVQGAVTTPSTRPSRATPGRTS